MGISGGNWFDGFGRFVEVRKMVKFGVDSPAVGPDLPTVLTFFVDFAKPGLPAAEQGRKAGGTPFDDLRRIRAADP